MDKEKELNAELEDEEMDYDIIQLVDEDGKTQDFEIVDCAEMDEREYMALLPAYDDPENALAADNQLVILRVAEDSSEDEDQFLETIADDEEYNKIEAIFRERLSEEFEFEDGEE